MKATEADLLRLMRFLSNSSFPYTNALTAGARNNANSFGTIRTSCGRSEEVGPLHRISRLRRERGLYHVTSVPQLLVIDGQQRLTTVTLLLADVSSTSRPALGARRDLRRTGGVRPAIETLRKATAEEPALEEAHVSLMRLHALSGRPERALAQYERLRDALQKGIGTRPTEATRRLRDEIAAGRLPTLNPPVHREEPSTGPSTTCRPQDQLRGA